MKNDNFFLGIKDVCKTLSFAAKYVKCTFRKMRSVEEEKAEGKLHTLRKFYTKN